MTKVQSYNSLLFQELHMTCPLQTQVSHARVMHRLQYSTFTSTVRYLEILLTILNYIISIQSKKVPRNHL